MNIKIFLFFLLSFTLCLDTKAQNDIAKKADSLFLAQNYTEAADLYETIYYDPKVNLKNISLKLAYIYENQGDYPKTLFYLNQYYNLKPSDRVYDKMNKIALMNKYTGYDRGNLNFILVLFQQYYLLIVYSVIVLGILLFTIFYIRKKAGRHIYLKNWMLVFAYLLVLGALLYLPSAYQSGIIKNETYLRKFPSSAAPIAEKITPGNKINIIGGGDLWYRALINKKIYYINKGDIWLLSN